MAAQNSVMGPANITTPAAADRRPAQQKQCQSRGVQNQQLQAAQLRAAQLQGKGAQGTPAIRREARRSVATVFIDGLGPIGLAAAEQLVSLQIGALLLRDETPVSTGDLGYRNREVGLLRIDAACTRLASGGPTLVNAVPSGATTAGVDIHAVILEDHPIPADAPIPTGPATAEGPDQQHPSGQHPAHQFVTERLHQAASAAGYVLPAVHHHSGVVIGPVATDAGGPCPDCLALTGLIPTDVPIARSSADPKLAAHSPGLVMAAAGMLVHQIMRIIDGEDPAACESAQLSIAASGALSQQTVTPHPECSCLMRLPAAQCR